MTLRLFHRPNSRDWRVSVGAGVAVAGLGFLLWGTPLGRSLESWSYDLLASSLLKTVPNEVVIIRLDEAAHQALKQRRGQPWDRALHARLVDKLREDQARLVIFDVFFTEPGDSATNELFAKSIRENGKVILAGVLADQQRPGISSVEPEPPLRIFREASAGWGLALLERDRDLTIRRHYPGTETFPSLPWAGAAAVRAPATQRPGGHAEFFRTERWIRYYDDTATFSSISYHLALASPPGVFKDKVVFIGGQPRTLFVAEEADECRTPLSRRTGTSVAGVDLQATQFLNLLHDEALTRLGGWPELLLVLVMGFASGLGLGRWRLRWAAGVALVAGLFTAASALLLLREGIWFNWLIIVWAQLPAAWALAWLLAARKQAPAPLIQSVPIQFTPAPASASPPSDNGVGGPFPSSPAAGERQVSAPNVPVPCGWAPPISGHTLLQRIGGGAYGDVWLARSIIGGFRAVKLIRRDRFRSAAPFEREFRGMQKFTPISLTHPGLVHVLHVDRDDAAGHFYYIMEAGDDEFCGQRIDPANYNPKTLAKELRRRGRLPLEECLQLGLSLAAALEHLHQQQLIHRDIKPSNIIFVNGQPKLADVGLVTDMGGPGSDVTDIGTEGYMAPEGPGTAAADLYSLGKVLYEAALGYDCSRFPELPTTLIERASEMPRVLDLNEIILKACSDKVADRYQTARELHAALEALQKAAQPSTQNAG